MEIAYWVVGGLLALFYLYAGGLKVTRGKEQLRPMMGWVDTVPMPLVRAIGVVELLGAIGLILPPLTGIAPGLALAAAIGFVVLQIGAAALHLSRGEGRLIGLNVVALLLAAATAWLATTWL
ncbi:DoxX family protein [Actinoplanes sp. KI2]|uniref:DoxX family protein n=1 Tax=Actinoplanes sp. KI2 TaxID=2983315 RepID=UPI0021D5AB77|nr:DoxX family protein [Actinoplanes sp. KI2]MCU7726283.1 DoxX family protein [Actinoplanes sp. KI2]